MKHPVIIGAGGVASYLLPVLLKSFKLEGLVLVDKDILETRNIDRQLFHPECIGTNKAQALVETISEMSQIPENHLIIDNWFTESTSLHETVDAIICCADNHAARYAAIQRADDLRCFAYIGGNEYLDSQAWAYHPDWKGTARDILLKYPNIATDETGSPIRCTGEAQFASPQLAIANLNCAAKMLHLMWVWEVWWPENKLGLSAAAKANLPWELFTSLTENTKS